MPPNLKKKKDCLDLLHGGGLEADPGEESRLPPLVGGEGVLLLFTTVAALLGLVKRAQPMQQLSLRNPPILHPKQKIGTGTTHGNIA